VIRGNSVTKPTGMLNTAPTNQDDAFPPVRAAAAYQFVRTLTPAAVPICWSTASACASQWTQHHHAWPDKVLHPPARRRPRVEQRRDQVPEVCADVRLRARRRDVSRMDVAARIEGGGQVSSTFLSAAPF
jgi:hypothetical protein